MENITATPINWKTLVGTIEEGKCVLFFGPEATVNYKDKEHHEKFFTQVLGEIRLTSILITSRMDCLF